MVVTTTTMTGLFVRVSAELIHSPSLRGAKSFACCLYVVVWQTELVCHGPTQRPGGFVHKNVKRLIVGIVCSLAICWAFTAHAWNSSSPQRGWVDDMTWWPVFAPGPSWPLTINGWACSNPSSGTSSDPTNVAVYQYTSQGLVSIPVIGRQAIYRPDVVSAGACSSYYSGFSVGARPVAPANGGYNSFSVVWLGGSAPYTLEGTTTAVVHY